MDLSDPDNTYGYALIRFAELIGVPFDPWQKWIAVHIGELLPDGRPRFRMALVLVARQNGKTTFVRVLTLFWMFIERVPFVLGTSTSREAAKESWREVIKMAEANPVLMEELAEEYVRETIGEETFYNAHGSRYRPFAPNRRAGRSYTVHRIVFDEIREHKTFDTYDAAMGAMNAVDDGQAVAISNQGDSNSIVLDSLRESALEFIETGTGDYRLFLAEWSCPSGSDPADLEALAYANPDLGNRTHPDNLISMAIRAKRRGGEELAGFKTEYMCQRVTLLDPAVDPDGWIDCGTNEPVDLAPYRKRLAVCADVSLDGAHVAAVAAAKVEGIVRVEVVGVWKGPGATKRFRAEFPDLIAQLRPRQVGWFPNGPTAGQAALLRNRVGGRSWAPRGTEVVEIKSEVTAVCMGLADVVDSREVEHPNDEMLTAHVDRTEKLKRGDAWVFTRTDAAPVNGTYALAGAAHMARTLRERAPLTAA